MLQTTDADGSPHLHMYLSQYSNITIGQSSLDWCLSTSRSATTSLLSNFLVCTWSFAVLSCEEAQSCACTNRGRDCLRRADSMKSLRLARWSLVTPGAVSFGCVRMPHCLGRLLCFPTICRSPIGLGFNASENLATREVILWFLVVAGADEVRRRDNASLYGQVSNRPSFNLPRYYQWVPCGALERRTSKM